MHKLGSTCHKSLTEGNSLFWPSVCTCVNPRVQLHVCTICLSTCYDYPCLLVVSADVACIPVYTCMYQRWGQIKYYLYFAVFKYNF